MILRRHFTASFLLMACALAIAGTGCREEPSQPKTKSTTAKTKPEESFEEIVRLVKDGIETRGGAPVTVVVPGDNASTRFQVKNTVTSKLIPPAAANLPYRGTITVTSTSTYSLRQTAEEQADKKDSQKPSNDDSNILQDSSDETDPGFSNLDNQLVTDETQNDKNGTQTIEKVQRRSDENVRTYQFAYEDGRWTLKSKLDQKTEKSIANAFNRALSLQP